MLYADIVEMVEIFPDMSFQNSVETEYERGWDKAAEMSV